VNPRRIALTIGRIRLAIGIGLLVVPGIAARVWGGAGTDSAGTRLFARTTGTREIALAIGTEISVKSQQRPADWLAMSAIADLGDGAISLATRRGPITRYLVGATALTTAVIEYGLARTFAADLGDDPRP
jgi:hypothetical protein